MGTVIPRKRADGSTGYQAQLLIKRAGKVIHREGRTFDRSPDGPVAEKTANPTGLNWSTPNSGVLVINEFGYRKEAAPGQLASWVRAAPIFNTSSYVDFEFGGRNTGNYAGYVLADQQFVQLAPVEGQAARGWYAGVSAMYAPPEFNRISQYYEFRLYGIGFCRPGRAIWCPWSFPEMSLATFWLILHCRAANSRIPAIFR